MLKDADTKGAGWAILIVGLLVLLLALYGCTQQQRHAGGLLIDEHPTQAVAQTYQTPRPRLRQSTHCYRRAGIF